VSVVCMHMMNAHVAGQSTSSIPSRKSSILSSRTKVDTLRLTELWRLLPRLSPSKAHCNALGSNFPGGGSCTARKRHAEVYTFTMLEMTVRSRRRPRIHARLKRVTPCNPLR